MTSTDHHDDPRDRRRDRRIAAGMAATGLATVVALAGVGAASGVPFLDNSPAPTPSAAGREFTYPTPSSSATAAPAPWSAPAASVVTAVASAAPATLAGTGAKASGDVTTEVRGTPFTRACGPVPKAAVPVAAAARTLAVAGGFSATVTVGAFGAGLGGTAVDALRGHLASCGSKDTVAPVLGPGAGVGADTFTATSASSGDGLAWAVWNTGDVVAHVTVTAVGKRPNVPLARNVAARVDTVLRSKLAGVCASLDSTTKDADRNPFGDHYTGLTVPVTVHAPAAPQVPAPKPTTTAPTATWTTPAATPRPDLAPPLQPDGWKPGDPPVSVQDAPRGPAPTLTDPDSFTAPTPAVTSAPVEPDQPTTPSSASTVRVRTEDRTGPGCGWAFTGMTVPVVDADALAKAKQERVVTAFAAMTTAANSYQVQMVAYEAARARWLVDDANYRVYRQYEQARAAATEQLEAAQRRYADAVSALNPAPEKTDPQGQDEPAPPTGPVSPTLPVTNPTTSGPDPSGAPTGSPTTSPTQQPTQTPTSTPTQEQTP